MRAFYSTNGKVQGGQLDAAVGTAAEAAKLLGWHGGDIRFFLAGAAGEDVNGTLFSQEYESPEALGAAFGPRSATNAELQALLSRLSAPGSPTTLTSQSMGIEMPLGRTPKAGRGSILEVHTSRINPGRAEDVVTEAAEVSRVRREERGSQCPLYPAHLHGHGERDGGADMGAREHGRAGSRRRRVVH